ncbi:hypothetical protein FACS18949_03230 [Clostridia bacterium]|nr:hypothetical protein FACS18949_03230 [Clostridia bacterium]
MINLNLHGGKTKTEQNIESHLYETFVGNARKNALEFIVYLRANDMIFARVPGCWDDKRY